MDEDFELPDEHAETLRWFEHLGTSEDQIAVAVQIAETRSSAYHADT